VTQVYDFLAPVLGFGNATALLLLIVLLLIGATRKFWVVLLYVSWEFIATVGLTFAYLRIYGKEQVPATLGQLLYTRLYWTNDVIADLLRFVLVAVLIYQVVGSSRPLLARGLSVLVLAAVVLPFLLFQPISAPIKIPADTLKWYPTGAWFNSTSQLLNFGAAIMNVILWGALIQSKKRDPQILALSIGLGILVTGTAISYGLRHFAIPKGELRSLFNLLLNLIQLAAWLIWCRTFWPSPKPRIPVAAVLPQ
jgi:hypothetical protein